jgi:hypothetical protein
VTESVAVPGPRAIRPPRAILDFRPWGETIARSQSRSGRSPSRKPRGEADPEATSGRTTTVWERADDDPTILLDAPPTLEDSPSDLDAPTRRDRPVADGPTLELPPGQRAAQGFSDFDEVLPSVLAEGEARSMHAEPTQNLISGVTRTLPSSSEGPTLLRDAEATVPSGPPPPSSSRAEAETVRRPASAPPRGRDSVPVPAPSIRRTARPRAPLLTVEAKSGLAGLLFGLALFGAAILVVALFRAL